MTVDLQELLQKTYGPFMDVDEIAALLKVKKSTIYSQMRTNTLTFPYFKHGKKYLFATQAVAANISASLAEVSPFIPI